MYFISKFIVFYFNIFNLHVTLCYWRAKFARATMQGTRQFQLHVVYLARCYANMPI